MPYSGVTLSELKSRLGITGSTQDTTLQAIIDGVEAQVTLYLGYDPSVATRTEYYSGTGTPYLPLLCKPVVSVTSVYYDYLGYWGQGDDPFPSNTLLTAGTDYALQVEGPFKMGILVMLNTSWQNQWYVPATRLAPTMIASFGNYKVVSQCGYNSSEMAGINQAIYLESSALYAARLQGAGIQTNSSLDGRSVSITMLDSMRSKSGMPRFVSPIAEAMLRPYRITPMARFNG